MSIFKSIGGHLFVSSKLNIMRAYVQMCMWFSDLNMWIGGNQDTKKWQKSNENGKHQSIFDSEALNCVGLCTVNGVHTCVCKCKIIDFKLTDTFSIVTKTLLMQVTTWTQMRAACWKLILRTKESEKKGRKMEWESEKELEMKWNRNVHLLSGDVP